MSQKNWNAGIIQPVPVAPAGPYQDGAAPGVWTLDQVAYWQKQGLWPTAGRIAFGNVVTYSTATGNSYGTFVVPAGVTVLRIKAWGAGGGAGYNGNNSYGLRGGNGGFSQADITVTPGETLRVYVGELGTTSDSIYYQGSGGGYSGVFRDTTPLIIGGAGGGGAGRGSTSWFGGGGGAGGGTTANSGGDTTVGSYPAYGGGGGSQSSGGSGGSPGGSSGSSLAGGDGGTYSGYYTKSNPGGGRGGYASLPNDNGAGGGGGGGYYGGGGGGRSTYPTVPQNYGGGGGGGSGYVTGTNTTITTGQNTSDVDYVSPAARAGFASSGPVITTAGNGLVVIRYTT